MKQPDLETFVENYFEYIGAERHEDVPGVVRYEIPPGRHGVLNAATLRVTLNPSLVERCDGVELLAPGSVLLDRIIEDAASRGQHCVAKVEAGESPPASEVLAANLSFRRVEPRIVAAEKSDFPYFLFTFRVSLVTDERTELLEHVMLNAHSMREHPVNEFFLEESLSLPEKPLDRPERLYDAYHSACSLLEKQVAADVRACRESANRRLTEEVSRIGEYFKKLVREAQQTKHPSQLAATIAALKAEEQKRLEEAQLKFRLDANARLVSARTIVVPTKRITVRLVSNRKSREVQLEYDEVGLETIPPTCEGCGRLTSEIGLCEDGHMVCAECEQGCAFCDRISCPACGDVHKVAQKCTECGSLLCGNHVFTDEFSLGTYCRNHILACPACGRNTAPSFVAKCKKCSQRYCFLCVAAKNKYCTACRTMKGVNHSDSDVLTVLAQSALAGKFGKWRKGTNKRLTIVEGRSMLARRVFVLDDRGQLIWEG